MIIKNKVSIFLTIVFLGFVGWWISFQHVHNYQAGTISWFENTYGLVALIGAIVGFFTLRKWGGIKTILGKSLCFFTVGLLAQEVGQLIYSYYTQVDKIQIPYPSWGDAAYFGSTLLYIVGAIYLARAAGARLALRKNLYKVITVAVPIIILAVSYSILMHNFKYGHSSGLAIFLDNGYPIGEAIYVAIACLAYLLSKQLLGGIMKKGILLLIAALIIQYVADFTFVYQGNRGTYTPGKYDDLFYLIAYYIMSISLLKFYLIYKGLMNKNKATNVSNHASVSQEK